MTTCIVVVAKLERLLQEALVALPKHENAPLTHHIKEALGLTCDDEGCPHYGVPHGHAAQA